MPGDGRHGANALEDQAGLVKATVLKALGKSHDRSVIPLLERR